MAERNKLVIIGNGFDLAHGLKTSYNDFISWYLNDILSKISSNKFEDKIIDFNCKHNSDRLLYVATSQNLSSIEYFLKETSLGLRPHVLFLSDDFQKDFKINRISNFLEKILKNLKEYSWVAIETEFYKSIIEIFNEGLKPNRGEDYHRTEIKNLNSDFEFIRTKLEEYLGTIDCSIINHDINNVLQGSVCRGFDLDEKRKKVIHFLNFNYTNTIEKYFWDGLNYQLNYIHGKLNTKDNPLIFGYGDEIDSYYEMIEHLNINEFLNHFKSFGYFKTENYSNLLRFIDSEPYDIEILGHSCGLSDRVLLNTIFEHDNCKKIKIHYYQKSETENDFITKTQEISRHFKDKAKMRARIVNFKECNPLVKYKPDK